MLIQHSDPQRKTTMIVQDARRFIPVLAIGITIL